MPGEGYAEAEDGPAEYRFTFGELVADLLLGNPGRAVALTLPLPLVELSCRDRLGGAPGGTGAGREGSNPELPRSNWLGGSLNDDGPPIRGLLLVEAW